LPTSPKSALSTDAIAALLLFAAASMRERGDAIRSAGAPVELRWGGGQPERE
jgi:hypothetical protein